MGHLDSGTKSRFDKTPREWLKVGGQINELVNQWAGRSDIVTFVGEGAGMGHAACYIPQIAEMEVNVDAAFGEGTNPTYVPDLTVRSNQFDYPVAMGAVMHEAFHAKHSKLDLLIGINEEEDKFVRDLATWFEETRIEKLAIKALPKNKSFLRACALGIVVGDLSESEDFTSQGVQAFSQLILLTLARVDAGSLKKRDVKIVQDAAEKLFGKKVLKDLRSIWLRAQMHRDDYNAKPLLKLGREWVKVLEDAGQDTKDPDQIPDWLKELLKEMVGEGQPGEGEDGEGGGEGSEGEGEGSDGDSDSEGEGSDGQRDPQEGKDETPGKKPAKAPGKKPGLLEKMSDHTATSAQSEANGQAVQEIMDARAEAKGAAAKEAANHKEAASQVYGRGTGPGPASTSSHLREEREPSADERRAAVALSKQLEKARYRDRVTVKRSSVVPPGRLNARRAVAAAEQKSRGAEVTSEAWSRKQRFHTEDPELTVGVLVDISGSMGGAMEPMASTAWILSEATRRIQGKCSMVYYGNDVFPTLSPGQHMSKVKVYTAPDSTEKFDRGFRALDGQMNLLNSSGARLLVICSDLYYTGWEGERTVYWMNRCREAGVAVVVIPFEYDSHAKSVIKKVKRGGVEIVPERLTNRDMVGAAKAIGEAAVRQLEKASS